ncbi:hypothetical protein C4F40_11375 [Sphingobacterium sp. Ka21]|uniref:Uncharacterized protein n=1 Tax=Sphingobacterium pedocola TaxID=2082722 RepID=A0ABR9T7L8_9SPHI|nr:hypothetical protein [Sphingobacterium pedocola]
MKKAIRNNKAGKFSRFLLKVFILLTIFVRTVATSLFCAEAALAVTRFINIKNLDGTFIAVGDMWS